MKRDPATILETIKSERRGGAPHEDWVTRNRDILMMQVRNTTDQKKNPATSDIVRHFFGTFVPVEQLAMATRAVGVFVLAIGIVLGGGLASAQVYSDAAPGELAYKLKLGVEKIQLTLAPNDEYRTRLHSDFADRRIDEIAKLAEADDQEALPDILASFESEIRALQDGLGSLRESDPEGVAEMAKLLERKMAVYHGMLGKSASLVEPRTRIAFLAAMDTVDGMSIAAMAVIVEKHLAGDSRASRRVVVSKFEDHLRLAEDKLESADGEAESVVMAKAGLAEAKTLVKQENYQAALSKIVEVAELTKEAEQGAAEKEVVEEEGEEEVVEEEITEEEAEEEVVDEDNNIEEVEEGDGPSDGEAADPAGSSEVSDDAVGPGNR